MAESRFRFSFCLNIHFNKTRIKVNKEEATFFDRNGGLAVHHLELERDTWLFFFKFTEDGIQQAFRLWGAAKCKIYGCLWQGSQFSFFFKVGMVKKFLEMVGPISGMGVPSLLSDISKMLLVIGLYWVVTW